MHFAKFMEVCLHGDNSYYGSAISGIGWSEEDPDFLTPPEAHPAFGASVANALRGMWQQMGEPAEFDIVEMGAGRGTLAKTILNKVVEYPSFSDRINYSILEQSPGLIRKQQANLRDYDVRWQQGSAYDLPVDNVNGAIVSVELLDTFGAHRVRNEQGVLREIYVDLDEAGHFVEVLGDVSPEISAILPYYHVELGAEVAIAPDFLRLQRRLSSVLSSGYIMSVDYGTDTNYDHHINIPRVYSRYLKESGGYPVALAYERPGMVDVTTSVDFDAYASMGIDCGLRTVTRESLAEFLNRNGFKSELEVAVRDLSGVARAAHYLASFVLTEPGQGYMGDFTVLVQEKATSPISPLVAA